MKAGYRWPAKLWEAVLLKAQEGHAPSIAAILYWGRYQETKTA